MFMNMFSLKVKKVHLRFEDDVYAERPFSFGFLVDTLEIVNYSKEIKFAEPLDLKYEEFYPANDQNLFLKKIKLKDMRVYWNSASPCYIPETLQAGTKGSRDAIFEAIGADILRDLMIAPFILPKAERNKFKRYASSKKKA